jgi:CBS domain-containing protein
VIDERKRLVGLVTHRDLVRAQISPLSGLTAEDRRARHEEVRLREIMTRDVWTVRADMLASVAGTTMLDHGYELAVKTLRMHDTTRTELPAERQLLAS